MVSYAKNVVGEIITVGRAETLIDWEGVVENRVYASLYTAENTLNWRVERINGRNIATMIVLFELSATRAALGDDEDPFNTPIREQIRVLKLVPGAKVAGSKKLPYSCVVEIWQRPEQKSRKAKDDWKLFETHTPLPEIQMIGLKTPQRFFQRL